MSGSGHLDRRHDEGTGAQTSAATSTWSEWNAEPDLVAVRIVVGGLAHTVRLRLLRA